jgi:hypothetical protein
MNRAWNFFRASFVFSPNIFVSKPFEPGPVLAISVLLSEFNIF